MKKVFIALGCSIMFHSAIGQITITQAAMPSAGDTIRYSTVNPAGLTLNVDQTSANHTWDYSSLTSSGQDISKYIAANKSPYAFYFFNQIGLKTADSIGVSTFTFRNIYSFYSKSSTVFKAEGLGYSISGIPLASKYSDEDEVYQFPLDYGDSDVSTFNFRFTIPTQSSFAFVQSGTRTNVVDGWGNITTPYKKYNSVLRVKVTVDEIDSVVTQFGKFPIPRKQVIYQWLSLTEHIPVLEITGTEAGSTFTATQIRFRDKYNGLQSPFKPTAGFSVDKTSGVVNTDTFKLSNSSILATNFLWQITPTSSSTKFVNGTSASSKNPQVVFAAAGLYTVNLLASNTFGSDDTTAPDLITITDPNNGVNNPAQRKFAVYPNPATQFLHLPDISAGTQIRVFNLSGALVLDHVSSSNHTVDISALAPGLYSLELQDAQAGRVRVLFCKQM